MRHIATSVLIILAVFLAAVYLPLLYTKLFFKPVKKTHLLFSPVTQRFIYKEKIVGPVPTEALNKAEDHHAEIAYRDANGTYYTRVEFEKNLPFIYYKNMELWGLLPLEFSGRQYGKKEIKENRQVLELKAGEINDRRAQTPLWPLLESNPGQARLVFPEDRFRMTPRAMEFVNADFNTIDKELTAAFTDALKTQGFVFPARSVNGKFTILKPFDEGAFLVDHSHQVFHVKRRNGKPVVVRTPIDQTLRTRHIKVSENKRRNYYGLLLAGDGRLFLLTYENYSLVPIPVEDYEPDRMDFKLLINPMYRTAVWSDDTTIRAAVIDKDYKVLDRYSHAMSRAVETSAKRVYEFLFPFSLQLEQGDNGYMQLKINPGNLLSLVGMLLCLICYTAWHRFRQKRWPATLDAGLVALTGLFGLIIVGFISWER
jgi:hypothetical protein